MQILSFYFNKIYVPKLKYLIVTTEAANADLLERFRPYAPSTEFVNLYSPTDATIYYCTAYRIPRENSKQHNGMIAIRKLIHKGHPQLLRKFTLSPLVGVHLQIRVHKDQTVIPPV